MNEIILAIVQPLLLLLLAPLFSGFGRVLRAKMHGRKGPSIMQDYYDIAKLFKREDLRTEHAGLPFRIMPVLFLATVLLLGAAIPLVTLQSPIPFLGDFILIVYLLTLPRFFFALASVDSSGSYPSVGGIRELLVSALIEPAIIIALFTVAISTGVSNVGDMAASIDSLAFTTPVAIVVAGCAMAACCYVELGKLPFDMAEAEQEIQEGPLAEYSGPSLAILKLAMSIKQILVVGLFVSLFFPFGNAAELTLPALALGTVCFVVKVSVVSLVCAFIENTVMRTRFKNLSRNTWMIVGCAVLSFVFLIVGV